MAASVTQTLEVVTSHPINLNNKNFIFLNHHEVLLKKYARQQNEMIYYW